MALTFKAKRKRKEHAQQVQSAREFYANRGAFTSGPTYRMTKTGNQFRRKKK